MKRAFLLLVSLAACPEAMPPALPAPPPAATAVPALEEEVRALEAQLAKLGLRVPAQLPDATARQVLESDAARAGATTKARIDPPRKGKVPFKSQVEPASRVWEVAGGALSHSGTVPPRLLVVVDHTGFIDGYFPVIPGEDLAAADVAPDRQAAQLERNVSVLRGRRAVVLAVTEELARQRNLIEAASRLGAQHIRIDHLSRRATLTFRADGSADQAVQAPFLKDLGIVAKGIARRVELTFPDTQATRDGKPLPAR